MKIIMIILLGLLLLMVVGLFILGKKSQTPPELGLHDGHLQPCVYSTNCVNSMGQGDGKISPIKLDEVTVPWSKISQLLTEMGGRIAQQSDNYLWVTFESKWFGFIDDLELLRDEESGVIHLRAASRVGRSDFGVNRERVRRLREKLQGK